MPIAQPSAPRRWHRNSEFGPGPRIPLCRERRAQWRARVELFRRAGRLTALHAEVGRALLRRLGTDGRCDPSHHTLAGDAGACPRTVRAALAALAACGLVAWTQRLVREGWAARQTSNAYRLLVAKTAEIPPPSHGGNSCRGTRTTLIQSTVGRRKVALERGGGPSSGSDEWARWNAARQIAALQGG